MSFSFSFSGDDIEDDTSTTSHLLQNHDASRPEETLTHQLQNTTLAPTLFPPKRHTLSDLLRSLPSQISYNYLDISIHDATETNSAVPSHENGVDRDEYASTDTTIRIPRRSLFDIRQQLMAESDPSNHDDEAGSLLSGLETGDLRSGIYEGGFKTWECAVDLGGFLARMLDVEGGIHVVELGAGSAVPSLVVLERVLRVRRGANERKRVRGEMQKVKFTLCDYNEEVLRLGTAVNVFLVAVIVAGLKVDGGISESVQGENGEEGEIDVDEDLIEKVLKMLDEVNIEIDFISGAWGSGFVQLTRQRNYQDTKLLLLASETIYSPDSLRVFSETVLDILGSTRIEKNAYVAAKKVYFGVGGGVQEFEGEVTRLGGRTEMVFDVKGSGVGRVVLEVFEGS